MAALPVLVSSSDSLLLKSRPVIFSSPLRILCGLRKRTEDTGIDVSERCLLDFSSVFAHPVKTAQVPKHVSEFFFVTY